MSRSDDAERAAELIERLLVDAGFRARFRQDPAAACHEYQLHGIADELAGSNTSAMQTLELRESKSSLAGVIMAAAAEGIGAVELAQLGVRHGGFTGDAARAVGRALSSPKLPALPASQLKRAGLGSLVPGGGHAVRALPGGAHHATPKLPHVAHAPKPHLPSPEREAQRLAHQATRAAHHPAAAHA